MERFKGLFFLLAVCLAAVAVAATVPSGTNLAAGKTAAVSCTYGSAQTGDLYQVSGLTDGTRSSSGLSTSHATCHNSSIIHFNTIGFSSSTTVGSVAMFWAYNGFQQNYMAPQEVNVSVYTGGAWVDKVTEYCFQGDDVLYADSLTVLGWDPAISVDSVKVWINPDMGYTTYQNLLWLNELEIYAAPGTGTPTPKVSPLVSSAATGFSMTSKNLKGATRFNVALPQQAEYSLSVFDVSGKNLWNHKASGSQQISWNHGKISGGVYMAVVNQNGHQFMHKFMIRQ